MKIKTRWDLTPLSKTGTQKELNKDLEKAKKESYKFINKWKDRKDYLTNSRILKEALDEYEYWLANYGATKGTGQYIGLKSVLNQKDTKLKAQANKIKDHALKIQNDSEFFTYRLSKIPPDKQKQFLKHPQLKKYKHFLETLFNGAKYLLSEPEEKILNLKGATSHSNWVKMVSEFISKEERKVLDEDGKKKPKTLSEISTLLTSPQKKVRDGAAKVINEIAKKYVDVAEHEINSILEDKKINDELRKMERPDLGRHLWDDIDTQVVDTLIEAVAKRFDIPRNYYKLKAKLLKTKKLKYHERNVRYGTLGTEEYPFTKSADLVYKTFSKLDLEFANIFKTLIEKGQVDVYPKQNKEGGAFCTHSLITHPTYILLNHTNKLTDVLTIAHETGHAINNELMRKAQTALNFGTPTSVAEVASTFMEDFVLESLAQDANDETRLSLMVAKLNDEVSTIQRQVACYRFEQDLHKSFREIGYLSKEKIGKLFEKHMFAYMGAYVEQSPDSQNWWVYWGHIRSFFYVYSYASGLLISKSLQNMVRKNPEDIKKVKDFLAAGCSDSPKNIFKKLDVDITDKRFWERGLDEQEKLLEETWTLAKKLGKI